MPGADREPGDSGAPAAVGAAEQRDAVEIVVVSPDPYMTYQPFLPEAAAGSISPRHVVVPLRRVLPHCRLVIGEVREIDHESRTARVVTLATVETGSEAIDIPYDEIVLAPGSVSRTLPVPGLAEHGIGFKTVEEAIGLRNHVLEQLDIASSTRDPALRDAALTFVFVGGGYAGVEALAELEDMARYACRYYHNIRPEELTFLLVEASDRILPEVGSEMGAYALRELRARNIDVRLGTRLESCENRVALLDDGSRHPARTLVWTAGVKPHPVLAGTGFPLTARGRVRCTPQLRVAGVEHAWAAGDAASVPDLTAKRRAERHGEVKRGAEHESDRDGGASEGDHRSGDASERAAHRERANPATPEGTDGPPGASGTPSAPGERASRPAPSEAADASEQAELPAELPENAAAMAGEDAGARRSGEGRVTSTGRTGRAAEPAPATECAPNAQHAVRQARCLADNIAASLTGRPLSDYRHSYAGSVASLGLHKGVAHVYGRKLKGYPAWFMHRAYHLSRVPTFNRKARVLSEWVLSGLFKREIVSLGSLEHPRAEFELAAGTERRPHAS
ncbi:NAD(P)/FAD-dependent oxidoreductase [Streptomyces sp. AJS327]|nr:NAD(P)/FAD-dependent oxidoreductase [Streptomyces sp. AJS327]